MSHVTDNLSARILRLRTALNTGTESSSPEQVHEFQVLLDDLERLLENLWLEEFSPYGLCMLCGNSGWIDTRETVTGPVGQRCGGVAFCLCPNGRARKELES